MDSPPDNLAGRSADELRELIRGLQATVARQAELLGLQALLLGGSAPGIALAVPPPSNQPGPRHAPRPL